MPFRLLLLRLPDSIDDDGVSGLAGGHHTVVLAERSPEPKVDRLPTRVSNDTARFFDQDRTRGVILNKDTGMRYVRRDRTII